MQVLDAIYTVLELIGIGVILGFGMALGGFNGVCDSWGLST